MDPNRCFSMLVLRQLPKCLFRIQSSTTNRRWNRSPNITRHRVSRIDDRSETTEGGYVEYDHVYSICLVSCRNISISLCRHDLPSANVVFGAATTTITTDLSYSSSPCNGGNSVEYDYD